MPSKTIAHRAVGTYKSEDNAILDFSQTVQASWSRIYSLVMREALMDDRQAVKAQLCLNLFFV